MNFNNRQMDVILKALRIKLAIEQSLQISSCFETLKLIADIEYRVNTSAKLKNIYEVLNEKGEI